MQLRWAHGRSNRRHREAAQRPWRSSRISQTRQFLDCFVGLWPPRNDGGDIGRQSARWLSVLGAMALVLAPLTARAQEGFRDDAGRQVAVPAKVEKVWPAGPPAEALVYILAPEKLLGWTHPFSRSEE